MSRDGAWRLNVSKPMTNPSGVLYGGVAVAASIRLAEHVVGVPTRWATTRFLKPSAEGDVLQLRATIDVAGRSTSHVTVMGTTPNGAVFETLMGVGSKPEGATHQWLQMPDAPPPESLESLPMMEHVDGTAIHKIERRLAYGPMIGSGELAADGRLGMWMRLPGHPGNSREVQGWLADCVPLSIAAATGKMPSGASLDNTMRFAAETPTDWVLVDIRAEAVVEGYGYGTVHLWAPDGTLLATGTQTAVIRLLG